jgi:D-beta-D-heptose 7-phosphate kinase/D-beta-D-heptose 1-phosphate adenosyltransferase
MLNKVRVEALLAGFARVKVLVVGDLMLDRYVFGSVTRISPEAPVPVVHVSREESRPGGASNVALNIGALGGCSTVAGVIGTDAAGGDLMRTLVDSGIRMEGVVQAEAVQTTVKTRVVAERQQVVRVDREMPPARFEAAVETLCQRLPALVAAADAVVIEDYGKGVICQRVIDAVLAAARESGVRVGFDPKDNNRLNLPWLTLATPNYREACLAAGLPETPLDDPSASETLREAGRILSARWGTELLMITLGPHGMYLLPRSGEALVLPTVAREVFDVSGAGDTVIATALTALAAGATHAEAAELANHAAGVVVGKLGTAVCTPSELCGSFDLVEGAL